MQLHCEGFPQPAVFMVACSAHMSCIGAVQPDKLAGQALWPAEAVMQETDRVRETLCLASALHDSLLLAITEGYIGKLIRRILRSHAWLQSSVQLCSVKWMISCERITLASTLAQMPCWWQPHQAA